MNEPQYIRVRNARMHNLKNIDVDIPRNRLVVFSGLSGSGKSTLAFDTLYAEGQRRYVESLSTYARQFLGQMAKPEVDSLEGLSPAVSIEQRTTSRNPRSTVGTITEVYDHLRLLFARAGTPHCPECGDEIRSQSIEEMTRTIAAWPGGTKVVLMAPLVSLRKGEHRDLLDSLRRQGYVRVRIDGGVRSLDEEIVLEKNKRHTIEAVVDRLVIKEGVERRLADSVATAVELGGGFLLAERLGEAEVLFSEHAACKRCGISLPPLSTAMFSFNSPKGACPDCSGLGVRQYFDPDLVVPDAGKSINDGAIAPWGALGRRRGRWPGSSVNRQEMESLAAHYGFSLDTPFAKIPERIRKKILFGSGREEIEFHYRRGRRQTVNRAPFEGVLPRLARRYRETASHAVREELEQYMTEQVCPACGGARLRPEPLAVRVGGLNIAEMTAMSAERLNRFFAELKLDERRGKIAERVVREIRERLGFLVQVGVGYLELSRRAGTLSGGEAQRIRLASQIGSRLAGVLYILDEPSIGLHQRDNQRLIDTLVRLRDLGNTVIVVEHDHDTIMAADHVVDMGPGAGVHGGEVVFSGPVDGLVRCKESLTGAFLSGRMRIEVPERRRYRKSGKRIRISGARANNLKDVDVAVPLGCLVCVTGVSGSGKSSLVMETLYPSAAADPGGRRKARPVNCRRISGLEHIDKVIDIDQSPIGRTPRSNPATYTGVLTPVRELFSRLPESRARGYRPGRFSFNVRGGRCEACEGDGEIRIAMHFLPDVYVTCEACGGKRYNRETLEIGYKGKTIADILAMNVEEALEFFQAVPQIKNRLATLMEVGLGYISLGQSSVTLSGGEAQRIKLARELSRRDTGRTLYILDEPTTGLHPADIKKLLAVLNRLVDQGNTVVIIEHNLDVIKTADYIIDLGPEGGDGGGAIVAAGTPEEVAAEQGSHTGRYLREVL